MEKDNKPSTPQETTRRVILRVGLFLAISFILSCILLMIDSFFFFLLPVTCGIIALFFVIKMILDAIKFNLINDLRSRNAYITGIIVIIIIEVLFTLWVVHVAGNILWV